VLLSHVAQPGDTAGRVYVGSQAESQLAEPHEAKTAGQPEHPHAPFVPPTLTDHQRAAARSTALAARKSRAEVRRQLAAGETTLADVIRVTDPNIAISKMRVRVLLESLPGIGKVRARELMEVCEISPTRRLQGLGTRQVEAVLARVEAITDR
jgi:hypothetical protein